jgi:outer membrane lipoprotein SlyB
LRRLALSFFLLPLAGCSQGYSANTYASSAAQQQAAVERGVIIGVRPVLISPNGAIGTAAGAAAGGIAGAQVPGSPVVTAFGAIGGTLAGGVAGAAAAEAVGNTNGWEYIVQETGNKLVSITQTSKTALPVGLSVLVIAGTEQARIVPDYTVQTAAASLAKTPTAPNAVEPTEIDVGPLPPPDNTVAPLQVAPINVAGDAPAAAAPAAVPPAASAASSQAPASAASSQAPASAASSQAAAPAAVSSKSPAVETTPAGGTTTPAPTTPAPTTPAQAATP